MPFSHDTTGVEESGNFAPVPENDYVVKIDAVQELDKNGRPLKSQNGNRMVKVRYKIAEGDYKGRKLFDNITFISPGAKGAGISKHFLHVIGEPYEGQFQVAPESWIGKSLKVSVTIDDSYDGKERNKIQGHNPVAAEEESDIPF